ncbi:GumC family protein [Pontibacter toksunensis]|uniref:GumC family protein n=1 Tax=Pontibacter toksunensis TaxID=1332631 RepID=A0ABW6BSZ0_9BACT
MTLREFKNLMRRNWLYLVAIPLVTAVSVFFFNLTQGKEYTSNTVIYTGIASGYRVTGDESSRRVSEGAYENLITLITSRDTKKEVILRLLASHLMMKERSSAIMNEDTYERLNELFSDSLKATLTGATIEETTENLVTLYRSDSKNVIYKLINSDDPAYSLSALAKVLPHRIGTSDLVQVEYVTNDPGVCYQTLQILTDVFTRKNKELFSGQNQDVMVYFDEATQNAYDKLQEAEQKLYEFNKSNNIIDYDQQIATTASDKTQVLDKLSTLEMQYAGAFSALKSVEESMKKRGAANLKSQEIMSLRSRLSGLNNQILELEMANKSENNERIARLKRESAEVSDKIKASVDNYYANTHSLQGAPIASLLDDYVRNTVLVEELKSQLDILRNQKENLGGEYEKLVPLGAEIRKIRREVQVAEQEYMAQLDGLKKSKLSQQNIELSSQLRVIDPPYYPISSSSTSLVLLVLFGFFGSLLLTGAGVFTADMIDNTMRKPEHAAKVTNFPIMGVLPTINAKSKDTAIVDQAENQLVRQLLLKIQQKRDSQGPFVIGVVSSHSGEGKSIISNSLTKKLSIMGLNTLHLLPDSLEHQGVYYGSSTAFYSPLKGVSSNVTVADLAGNRVFNHAVVIVEFPALLEETYPVSLLQYLDMILVTVKADRTWEQADKILFDNIQRITKAPIEIVLNGVYSEYLEDFLGGRVKPVNLAEAHEYEAPKQVDEWKKEPAVLNS